MAIIVELINKIVVFANSKRPTRKIITCMYVRLWAVDRPETVTSRIESQIDFQICRITWNEIIRGMLEQVPGRWSAVWQHSVRNSRSIF